MATLDGFDLPQFLKDRDAALLSLDRATIVAFQQKYGAPTHPVEEVFWASVHKARTAVRTLPIEARQESKRWLLEHGYRSEDDGEV